MKENNSEENLNPADYYQSLDYTVKMLFKREVIKRLEWSDRTFSLRMKKENFRPGEMIMIENIITNKSFLNV